MTGVLSYCADCGYEITDVNDIGTVSEDNGVRSACPKCGGKLLEPDTDESTNNLHGKAREQLADVAISGSSVTMKPGKEQ